MNTWCRRTLQRQRMADFVLMITQVTMRLKQALNMKKTRFKMKEQYDSISFLLIYLCVWRKVSALNVYAVTSLKCKLKP